MRATNLVFATDVLKILRPEGDLNIEDVSFSDMLSAVEKIHDVKISSSWCNKFCNLFGRSRVYWIYSSNGSVVAQVRFRKCLFTRTPFCLPIQEPEFMEWKITCFDFDIHAVEVLHSLLKKRTVDKTPNIPLLEFPDKK